MKLKDYQKEAQRTDAPLNRHYDKLHAVHMVMGMTTEVGELVDVFKKDLAYNKPVDWVNVKEEIGDLMWYVANFCTANNIDLEEVMETNINKLKSRYPEKFSTEKAINRELESERIILEANVSPGKRERNEILSKNKPSSKEINPLLKKIFDKHIE